MGRGQHPIPWSSRWRVTDVLRRRIAIRARAPTRDGGTVPQVMRGRYDHSADVFSFGIVISEVVISEEAQMVIDETRTSKFGLDEQAHRQLQMLGGVDGAGVMSINDDDDDDDDDDAAARSQPLTS